MSSKIEWCLEQEKGIKLIEPNENLVNKYLESCNEDLENVPKVTGKWKTVTSYYACYNALYALLCKVGIKSEIHDCSIALMDLLGYDRKDIDFLRELKEERIDVQYYLEEPSEIDLERIKEFVEETKRLITETNDLKVEEIRGKINSL